MAAASAQSLERRVGTAWRFKLTAVGKCILAGILVSGSVGSASLEIPVYRLFCALMALYVTAYFAGVILRPVLRISGSLPERGEVGQRLRAAYTVTNVGKRVAYDVGLRHGLLPSGIRAAGEERLVDQLRPGESAQFAIEIDPLRRGLYAVEAPTAYTTFPFHFFRIEAHTPEPAHGPPETSRLVVTPSFQDMRGMSVPIVSRYQPGGIALTSNVGESPEFIGNRDYRPGDPTRRIDFRAWARLARPVVREYQEEYYSRVGLVLDTSLKRSKRGKDEPDPAFEAAVSLAASIADAMAQGEYIVDLFAAGSELYVFRAGRHTAHVENILEILACVEPNMSRRAMVPDMTNELPGISTLFCVFLSWDKTRSDLVQAAREAGCTVRVLLVKAGPVKPVDDDVYFESVIEVDPEQIRRHLVSLA